ncbi:universal stress protein [Nocardioides sp. cx-173]|uniref:universal stress protein n=1 Tax=Nocardioides sp. cx-173 TaxID=2898796 RepID=UPI001E3437A4|nr:universal stress protein [Nocardioides sp. cx-173]MCD4525788.1 universal stress protein [Nocardioides sp. cx-173]UGB39945.1 universal stress protein [Nocardioides sp. cx-173]
MTDAPQTHLDSIFVGFDGSAPSEAALEWAAEQASLEGRPLVLVHAVAPLSSGAAASLGSLGIDTLRLREDILADAEALLERARKRATAGRPDLEVHQMARIADPRETLLSLAGEDRLVVVGSRGMGPVRSLLLGSVSLALTKHASGPVVIVRPNRAAEAPGDVLVAVALDGTDGPVLDLAFRVASFRGQQLTVLHCFWDASQVSSGSADVPDDEPGLEDLRAQISKLVEASQAAYPSVPVHLQLARGFVDARLLEASRHTGLVVLGHQRKPLLGELVYGSVAPQVVEASACSVAVVGLADPEH